MYGLRRLSRVEVIFITDILILLTANFFFLNITGSDISNLAGTKVVLFYSTVNFSVCTMIDITKESF